MIWYFIMGFLIGGMTLPFVIFLSAKKEEVFFNKDFPFAELYTPKPSWMKIEAWCYCQGEAFDKYTVLQFDDSRAFLLNDKGEGHGWEYFQKLHRGE